jgi:putative membrane protein
MSEPTSPDDAAVGPPERLNPLYLLNGFRRTLRSLSGAYALIAYFAVQGRWATAIIAAVAILAVGIAVTILRWLRFEFRVGRDEIRIDSGIFSRRHRSIPFDRIQDVDIVQGPLARLLGLAEVTFDTGGGGSGRHPEEGALHAISLNRAEEIRALIRGRRVPAPTAAATGEERPPLYRLSFGRLLLAGLFNFSLAMFAGLFGLTQTVGQPLGIDPFQESFWRDLLASSTPVETFVLVHRTAAIAAGIALLIILGVLTGMVRTVLRDFDFRLDRTGTGLRRRRGLLTKTDVTLPVGRVQAALVVSGPVREQLGWADLFVQSLAQEEKSRGNHELAPLVRPAEIDLILEEIGWRPIFSRALVWKRVSQADVWTFALGLVPLILVAIVAMTRLSPLAAAVLLGSLLLIGVRALAWRRIGYIVDGDRLLMRSGWWRRRLVVLPKARIQSMDFTQSFLARWFGTATLQFGVAGGRATTHIIPAIPSAEARALRDDLLSSLA